MPENTRSATKTRPYDAFAASGKAPARGEQRVVAYDAVRRPTDHPHRAIRLDDGRWEWRPSELPVDAPVLT
ncbi:hypothetical protein ACGF7W_33605 [Streptomyces sp. NPDC048219]|uniref:hypothetical protein n=1 Tax=unclassified Streptomyces TaxID=2593676 RepID=UPI00342B8FD0